MLITIDSPDFSLRVARLVKEASNIRTVHYVAPTVWAWRPGRAQKMARRIDHVLALFPFEPPLMQAAGMACDFVGHPIVAEPVATKAEVQAFRAEHGLGEAPILLALPGSRRAEVARLARVFGQAAEVLRASHPDLRIVVPTVAATADQVRAAITNWPANPILLDPRVRDLGNAMAHKRAAFGAANIALAASGTVSLELAAANTPMVIAYDMSRLSMKVMRRMLLIDTVTLVNLVSETRHVPEFLGEACQPGPLGEALRRVMADPEGQQAAMALSMQRLGQGGEDPGLRAAQAVLDRL